MSVTPEKLRAWYAKEGKTIVEACKASPDFAETWKERITEHNAIYVVKNLFLIPTTINGIVLVFGVKVASIHNMIALLAGEDMSKIDLVRKKSPYLTAEEIRHWYNNE